MPRAHSHANPEVQVVWLAQRFQPSLLPTYLKWIAIWRADPIYGRGRVPPPVADLPQRGDGLFWELLDPDKGAVQCYLAPSVRDRLLAALDNCGQVSGSAAVL